MTLSNNHVPAKYGRSRRRLGGIIPIPSLKIEYAYYLSLIYAVFGPAVGVEIPLLAGGMILVISAVCIRQFRSYAKAVFGPIALLIACGTAFVFMQIVVHGESITDADTRAFIIWILGLIIVRALCLRRGFSRRFPFFLFIVGAITLPFLSFDPGEIERARVESDLGIQGGLGHPGGLAEWFGFCAVYFAILGFETKRNLLRLGAWLAVAGSLFVVTLTVSRSVLFAVAISITVGFRDVLKRGFVPLLILIILAGVFSAAGLFDQAVSHYTQRGMEETGREVIWPAVIERIFTSPLVPFVGVGVSKVGTYGLSPTQAKPPHNSFLYFALSSGVVPLAFWVVFWTHAAWKSLAHAKEQKDRSFQIPYLLFTFVSVMLGDLGFMSPWALLALSVGAGPGISHATQFLQVARTARKRRIPQIHSRRSPATNSVARSRT